VYTALSLPVTYDICRVLLHRCTERSKSAVKNVLEKDLCGNMENVFKRPQLTILTREARIYMRIFFVSSKNYELDL